MTDQWITGLGALGGVTFAVIMVMPGRKIYASSPRWLSRIIRISAAVYGLAAAAYFVSEHRVDSGLSFFMACISCLCAIIMAVSIIAAWRMGAGGI